MKFYYENFDWETTEGSLDEVLFSVGAESDENGEVEVHFGYAAGARHLTVAWTETGELAGLHLYDVDAALESRMLWVDKKYRRRGVARQMFELSLSVETPARVEGFCISPGSLALIGSLSKEHPAICWNVDHELELAA